MFLRQVKIQNNVPDNLLKNHKKMQEIYTDEIIALASQLKPAQAPESFTHSGFSVSKVCGSKIDIWLEISKNNSVMAISQKVKACLIGQASAAIFEKELPDMAVEDILDAKSRVTAYLKGDENALGKTWQSYKALQPVRQYPSRWNAVTLPFDAFAEALKNKRS